MRAFANGSIPMAEPSVRLFCVEFRRRGETQTLTGFVPASDAGEAIRAAQATATDIRAQGHDVADLFQDHSDLEVRVGTFGSNDPPEVEFGDWLPLP